MYRILVTVAILIGIATVTVSNDYCPNYSPQDLDRIRTSEQTAGTERNSYRAAIVEHNRIDRADIRDTIKVNLALFEQAAKIAANEGAEIIVFPEDGLLHGLRDTLEPVVQEIPDPGLLKSGLNNPCQRQDFYESFILKNLSCLARENNLYVVANFGTKYVCEPGSQIDESRTCPVTGALVLNTDVILDNRGNYLKRYYKVNMFLEVFDKSPSPDIVYLDTPFGRFGIFTCFDVLFKTPAINLIEDKKVDTILFPTWWFDEVPLLTAVHVQDAWSAANDVNILAANINRLRSGSVGSGIFSGNNSIYTRPTDHESKLILATLPSRRLEKNCPVSFDSKVIKLGTEAEFENYSFKNYELKSSDTVFELDIDGYYHKEKYCSGSLCCDIAYQTDHDYRRLFRGEVILVVRDSIRTGQLGWYEQVCFVATLAKPFIGDFEKVKFTTQGLVKFRALNLMGRFSTKYLYPITAHSSNNLLERDKRAFKCDFLKEEQQYLCTLSILESMDRPINVFGLYGRKYSADRMPEGW